MPALPPFCRAIAIARPAAWVYDAARMNAKSFKTLVARLCVLIALLSGLVPAPGLVFCFGEDGHFDVAAVDSGCGDCADEPAMPQPRGPRATAESAIPACCPCLDLAIDGAQEAVRQTSARPETDRTVSDGVLLAITRVVPRLSRPATRRALVSHPPRSAPLPLLRSVILTI